jgi:hypothetical protein
MLIILLISFILVLLTNIMLIKLFPIYMGDKILFLRRSFYAVPYLVVFIIYDVPKITISSNNIVYIILATAISMVLISIQWKEFAWVFQKDLLQLFPCINGKQVGIEIYTLILAVIVQELYYKLFVLQVFCSLTSENVAILSTSILFVVDHIISAGAKKRFKYKDFILQFIMSLSSCIIF